MYTSGSTGAAKGVVISHAAIRNRVLWTIGEHGLGPADRVLQKTTVSFDAAMWEFLAPLASGGTVVVAGDGVPSDPAAMARAVAEHRVTVLQLVPSVLRALVPQPALADCDALRLVFSAGEPLPAELCDRLLEQVPVTLVNTYGPTECAIDVTSWRHPGRAADGAVDRRRRNGRGNTRRSTGSSCPSATPWTTPASWCSTPTDCWSRSASPASCASPARDWPGATPAAAA